MFGADFNIGPLCERQSTRDLCPHLYSTTCPLGAAVSFISIFHKYLFRKNLPQILLDKKKEMEQREREFHLLIDKGDGRTEIMIFEKITPSPAAKKSVDG